MSDELEENVTAFQQLLMDGFWTWAMGQRRSTKMPSETDYAKYLGVNQSALNHWINGVRVPSVESAITLSRKLGVRVFETLGYPPTMAAIPDDMLFVAENWYLLTPEVKRQISEHVAEEAEKARKK